MFDPDTAPHWMELDKKGAKAFLNGERLLPYSKYETLFENRPAGKTAYTAELVKSPYEDEHILQIIDEKAKEFKLAMNAALIVKKNEDDTKSLEIHNLNECGYFDDESLALEAIETARQKLGCDSVLYDEWSARVLRDVLENPPIIPEDDDDWF